MAAVLSAAGHEVEMPADAVAWVAPRPSSEVVLLTMVGDQAWQVLAGLRHVPVIAVIEDGLVAEGVRAAQAGARSVLARGAAREVLRRTVEATLDGQAVLPAAVAELLAGGRGPAAVMPDPDRVGWLGKLASGVTVAALAAQAGYSERAMFRLLAGLYREMGARNRIEAVVQARDRGWI